MNTLGRLFQVTSFGESHGPYVGCVLDGVPAGFQLDTLRMQEAINRRKTGQSTHASSRREEDILEIVSGVFDSKTTGSPLTLLIRNQDAQSADYDNLKDVFRPNHADYTYQKKYGHRDHRGGGRSSVRITAPLVAAGDLAWQILRAHFAVHCKVGFRVSVRMNYHTILILAKRILKKLCNILCGFRLTHCAKTWKQRLKLVWLREIP